MGGTHVIAVWDTASYIAIAVAARSHICKYSNSFCAIGIVLTPRKFVAIREAFRALLAAISASVGMAATAALYAAITVSCSRAAAVALALFCKSQARYGTCAATNFSAVGPCHVPACTSANNSLSSVAAVSYSALKFSHAVSEFNNEAGPGPVVSAAEFTSGGKAAQIGIVIVGHPRRCDTAIRSKAAVADVAWQ